MAGKNTWEEIVKQYNEHFILAEKELQTIKEKTDSYNKIVKFIKNKKSVNKNDILDYLNWGIRISFGGYRNLLRKENKIKFTKDRYEVI